MQNGLQAVCTANVQRQFVCLSQRDHRNVLVVRNDHIAGNLCAVYTGNDLGVTFLPAADLTVFNGGNRFIVGLPFDLLALCALQLQGVCFKFFHRHAVFVEKHSVGLTVILLLLTANRRQ